MAQQQVLDIFNSMVVKSTGTPDLSLANIGVVTNFKPTPDQRKLLQLKFKPLAVNTLFTREERLKGDPMALITKQILHYIEVYGLGQPGLFDLTVHEGLAVKLTYVQGITVAELSDKVRTLLYTNAPIKDVAALVAIIRDYNVDYDFSKIRNNEARIQLYDSKIHQFATGDDAVRYMVFKATGNTMVIKSKRVIEQIKAAPVDADFFVQNEKVLAEVFNRFKPLILAAKRKGVGAVDSKMAKMLKQHQLANVNTVNTAINRIARLSKSLHKPVHEGVNKRFLALAMKQLVTGSDKAEMIIGNLLPMLSIRDKFKILNLIEYKKQGFAVDSFVIRNGRVHVENNRPKLDAKALTTLSEMLLKSVAKDLVSLKDKNILLDAQVDFGLPISRKQTLGNLPFGTLISVDGEISSGVYWENGWGARDLDLSTVDMNGHRTGWGRYSGYDKKNPVTFSGDMTYADPSAMEFMTSKGHTYGLFVNIFSGDQNAECELIVGSTTDKKWMSDVIVRERTKLTGRGSVIGFVENQKFRVFQGMLNDRIANFGEVNPVIKRAVTKTWTVRELFDAIDISYDVSAQADKKYDFNLSYSGFSIDKLEELLYI